jgi:hypothetical protein
MTTDALTTNDQSPPSEVCAPASLLSCSDTSLDNYELAKLSEVANLRSQLHRLLDELIDANKTRHLARLFFKSEGRKRILRDLAKFPKQR